MYKRLLILLLAVIGIVVIGNAARSRITISQQPRPEAQKIYFTREYTLAEPITQDIVVFAQDITLAPAGRIIGDVALVGRNVTVNSTINGDVTIMADTMTLGTDALVSGNVILIGSTARLAGTITGIVSIYSDTLTLDDMINASAIYPCSVNISTLPAFPDTDILTTCSENDILTRSQPMLHLRDASTTIPLLNIQLPGRAGGLILLWMMGMFILSALSVLAIVIFPRQISHIEEAIQQNPRQQATTGIMMLLLTAGMGFAGAALLALLPPLGLILLPIFMALALLLAGMLLAGWVTVTLIVGSFIINRLVRHPLPPLFITALGNIVLLVLIKLLVLNTYSGIIAAIGLLAISAVGLGATFITRLGTRPIHKSYLIQG